MAKEKETITAKQVGSKAVVSITVDSQVVKSILPIDKIKDIDEKELLKKAKMIAKNLKRVPVVFNKKIDDKKNSIELELDKIKIGGKKI